MEFMHLHPHAQMPDDDTTSDYRYDLLDTIYVYNADYVNKASVCINYMRSHLITADAIVRCDPWGFYLTPQNTLLQEICIQVETRSARSLTLRHGLHIHRFIIDA